jgi:hypothetical protein
MGASVSIRVPSWQRIDTFQSQRQFANLETRNELKRRLITFNIEDLTSAGDVNRDMMDAVVDIIGSRGTTSEPEFSTLTDEDIEGSITARRAGIEFILGIGTRLRNQNVYNFFIVILSILALASNLSESMWHLMCMMGALFSKTWTTKLAKELGDEVSRSRPADASANVGFGVSDNKAYFVKTSFMHAHGIEGADEPQRANGEFLYTVNNLQVPVIIEGEDFNFERG